MFNFHQLNFSMSRKNQKLLRRPPDTTANALKDKKEKGNGDFGFSCQGKNPSSKSQNATLFFFLFFFFFRTGKAKMQENAFQGLS